MSHSILAVLGDTSVLEKDIKKQKQMEVVLAGGQEQVILQCAPPLRRNELTVKLMSVQSIKREGQACIPPGLPLTHRCASVMHYSPKWRAITTVNTLP